MASGPAIWRRLVLAAAERFRANASRSIPLSAHRVFKWRDPRAFVLGTLSGRTFPIFEIPLWFVETLPTGRDDPSGFLSDVIYSTLHLCYFVRMMDDVADGDHPDAVRKLLPLAGYFHSEFQSAYRHHFVAESPFWASFDAIWHGQADLTTADAHLSIIGEDTFRSLSALKSSGAKVPLAAIAERYSATDSAADWYALVDALGALHQMSGDFLDWESDQTHGIVTLVQSQFKRQRDEGEDLASWLRREGMHWAEEHLRRIAAVLTDASAAVASPSAVAWADRRRQYLAEDVARASRNLARGAGTTKAPGIC